MKNRWAKPLVSVTLLVVGLGASARAESYTTNLIDGVTFDLAGPYVLGDTGPFNFLVITNAGALTNTIGTIGNTVEAYDNGAVVTGAGSVWHSIGELRVGAESSSNVLAVSAGGWVNNSVGSIGWGSNAHQNRVQITDAGSRWNSVGPLRVGSDGSGNELAVQRGGRVETSMLSVGVGAGSASNTVVITGAGSVLRSSTGPSFGGAGTGNRAVVADGGYLEGLRGSIGAQTNASNNVVVVTDPGSAWTNRGGFTVGAADGGNFLVVSNSGRFVQIGGSFLLGDQVTASGNALVVTGAGSECLGPDPLYIGNGSGQNQLLVADGARLQSGSATLGMGCSSASNQAVVTGAGTVWVNNGLTIGYCNTGNSLTISDGARVLTGAGAWSGVQGGGTNTMVVTGANSLWHVAGYLRVGNTSTGDKLEVSDGARLESGVSVVGGTRTGNQATIRGTGSSWSNATLTVGSTGFGNQLSVLDGATLESAELRLGNSPQSGRNVALVAGHGTICSLRSNLFSGYSSSSNDCSILDGAMVTAQSAHAGAGTSAGHRNRLRVEGQGTVLMLQSNLHLASVHLASAGVGGSWNRLEVLGGAQVHDIDGYVGDWGGVSNSALVSGPGSQWHNRGSLHIGRGATRSELVIADAGLVTSVFGHIGSGGYLEGQGSACQYVGSGSKVWVTGPGSVWENREALVVGGTSLGNVLTVSNAGRVLAASLTVGQAPAEHSLLPTCPLVTTNNVTVAGGWVVVTNAAADGMLEARYGTVKLRRGRIIADRLLVTNTLRHRFEFSGGVLCSGGSHISNDLPFAVGDGLNAAEFQLAGGTHYFHDGLMIAPNAVLTGDGTVARLVNVAGALRPGSSFGRLEIEGRLNLFAGSALSIQIGGLAPGTQHDFVSVSSVAQLNGALWISCLGGYRPAALDVFTVLQGSSLVGAFTNAAGGERLKTTDGLGTFRVDYAGNSVVLSDYQSTDQDGDGVEDAWATRYFGHSPLTAGELAADADGDGASNREEFAAGTDPGAADSVLRPLAVRDERGIVVRFRFVPGKTYRIWYSGDLEAWSQAADPGFVWSAPDWYEWVDDGANTGGLPAPGTMPACFYRVSVE